MYSLESPHRGDSNEYTQYTIFNIKKKIIVNYSKLQLWGFFSKGLKDEFETAVVYEPSMFEPLKFYCMCCSRLRTGLDLMVLKRLKCSLLNCQPQFLFFSYT